MENHVLKVETIRKAIESPITSVRILAMKACIGRADVPLEIILAGLHDPSDIVSQTATEACQGRNIPIETIKHWLGRGQNWQVRCAAMKACIGRTDIPMRYIEFGLADQIIGVSWAAAEACQGRDIPVETIREWAEDSQDWCMRLAAMKACMGRTDTPIRIALDELLDRDNDVCQAAIEVCQRRDVSKNTIRAWLGSRYWSNRLTIMKVCIGQKNLPLDIILTGLRDPIDDIKQIATEVCRGRNIPVETIQSWLENNQDWPKDSPDWRYRRLAAMKACIGRTDVPLEIISTGLRDQNAEVRQAAIKACIGRADVPLEIIQASLENPNDDIHNTAMEAYLERGVTLPVSRDFSPKGYVYKRCLNDVIAVATIPPDAHVRGQPGEKCRASKARIEKIIGDFYGEKVGISLYDNTVLYHEGDIVEIKDFDLRHKECSTGFHFFDTEKATKYYAP